MDVDVVIVAGGRATRLRGLTRDVPKCLLPVGGTAVLDHQLAACAPLRARRTVVAAGHLGDAIVRHAAGTAIEVVVEERPLGSGGAVRRAVGDATAQPTVVLLGDVMTNVDLVGLLRTHLDTHADATVLLHANDHVHDSDLVELDGDGRVIALHRKPHPPGLDAPNLVVAGAFVLSPSALARIPADGPADLTQDVVGGLVASGARVAGHRSVAYARDMGTPERYAAVEDDWASGRIAASAPGVLRPGVIFDRDGTLMEPAGLVTDPDQVVVPDRVGAAIAELNRAGFLVAVATNQPVLARGLIDAAGLRRVHHRLEMLLARHSAWIDAFFVCPHHPDGGYPGEVPSLKRVCTCRKPAPGLLEDALRALPLDRGRTLVVGDQPTDVEAARRVGLAAVQIRPEGARGTAPTVAEALAWWTAASGLAAAGR